MAQASVLGQYTEENEQERVKARRSAQPLTLLGYATAVFLGMTAWSIVGYVANWLAHFLLR